MRNTRGDSGPGIASYKAKPPFFSCSAEESEVVLSEKAVSGHSAFLLPRSALCWPGSDPTVMDCSGKNAWRSNVVL